MKRIQTFIDSLEKLYEEVSGPMEFQQLVFQLGFDIGMKLNDSGKIEHLKNRMKTLVAEDILTEEFLVISLLNKVDQIMHDQLERHGEIILNNEGAIKHFKEKKMDPPKVQYDVLNRLKNPTYTKRAKIQIDTWQKIKSSIFTLSQFDEWRSEEMITHGEKLQKFEESLSDDEKNMTIGELLKRQN